MDIGNAAITTLGLSHTSGVNLGFLDKYAALVWFSSFSSYLDGLGRGGIAVCSVPCNRRVAGHHHHRHHHRHSHQTNLDVEPFTTDDLIVGSYSGCRVQLEVVINFNNVRKLIYQVVDIHSFFHPNIYIAPIQDLHSEIVDSYYLEV